MAFPDITDIDFSKDQKKVKEMLDYAVDQYESRRERRARLEKLYSSYNGIIDKAEIDSIIKTTGKKSKTKYVKYRLGRTKMKQLHGEFLEIPIKAQVATVNREAQNEKMQKYKTMLGMAIAKPQIEQVRSMGYDVFPGMEIPDKSNKKFWDVNNFKLANERVMGTIIKDKLINQRLKTQFYQNFVDLTIAAEMFGKNERDADGIDTYRYIPAKYAMYEETVFDPNLERSPYLGEVRPLYYHEILTNPEFKLNKDQKDILKEARQDYNTDSLSKMSEMINGNVAFYVYTIQWKGLEKVYLKTSEAKGSSVPYKMILSEEYYDENKVKIEKDVKAKKYKVEIFYREIVWTASRIHKDIYTIAKKEKFIIQRLNENGKFRADFDYTGLLFSTVNGWRVSVQEVIYELERIYDDIRFMINKEIRKIRGDTLIYDDAFLPKGKQFIDILHSVSEDGVVRYNSSSEGNMTGSESDSNKVGIGALNLGQSQALIVLMNQAMDVERVMDRITGMNDARQGLEKATATASGNQNNIEASRSMTYDIFYFMKDYEERVLMKLAEKTKLNQVYFGKDGRQFVFSDSEIKYLITTKNLIFSNYAVSINDGRREQDVLQKIEQMFPQEINAGGLRTKDVAKFLMEDNFAHAIKVLDEAHEELEAIRIQQSRVDQESQQQATQAQVQMATDDREDRQNHDKEMEVLRIEGKKEIEAMKGAFKATQDFQNNTAKASIAKTKQAVSSNPFE